MNIQTPLVAPDDTQTLYDRDFAAWLFAQADALSACDATRVDWTNLAEEIESMGNSQRRELQSRLRVLIVHILKLRLSRSERPRAGWEETILTQRTEIHGLLRQSPSLRPLVAEYARDAFDDARPLALAALKVHEPALIDAYRAAAGTLTPDPAETLLDREWFPPVPPTERE